MSVADVVIVLIAVAIVAFGIIFQLRRKKKAKELGVPSCDGCTGCSGGMANKECPSLKK